MSTSSFVINNRQVGVDHPVYFVADIAANHDGDLERAKDLIFLAAESGAEAAKFQHFKAETIVSDFGFRALNGLESHQSTWNKSVFQVYKDASVNLEWTEELVATCKKAGIAFFTSPYSKELVEAIEPFVSAYKIGSGDITWTEIVKHIASKHKPYMLASGASNFDDVHRAVSVGLAINKNLCLMQCNTNYTGSRDNLRYVNLNVIKAYREMYPGLVLGLSDHTSGNVTVMGAIALGAKIIEKHFTDNTQRNGPDHKFSMNPLEWKEMIDRARDLETSLGGGVKQVEVNEKETYVLQRRAIRLKYDSQMGKPIHENDLEMLRPCPVDAINPYDIQKVIGKTLNRDFVAGDYLKWNDIS